MMPRQLIALIAFLLVSIGALAAPKAELWQRWVAHRPESSTTVDHTAWDVLLKAHLVSAENGLDRFRYGSMNASDRAVLADYLAALQAIRISEFNRAEQRAYWINLYNAATVKVVLDHYPVRSIREIRLGGGFLDDGPWSRKWLKVEGEALSLDDIEHRILRPIWKDPRIHYAVNCASVGCPNLSRTAYRAGNFDNLAEAGARAYVNSPRGVRVENGRLHVSSIYEWFKADFGGSDGGVIAHLKQYAEPALGARLETIARIDGDAYDWSLNDAR
jgi:hypothetical protein